MLQLPCRVVDIVGGLLDLQIVVLRGALEVVQNNISRLVTFVRLSAAAIHAHECLCLLKLGCGSECTWRATSRSWSPLTRGPSGRTPTPSRTVQRANRRTPPTTTRRDIATDTGTHAAEGVATGIVAGGVLGGRLVGVDVSASALPCSGRVRWGAGGAAVGAVTGSLVPIGIHEEEASYYEGELRGGRTLVAVHAGCAALRARAGARLARDLR